MAGHSKWANIRRTKEVVDHKRGRLFMRLAREITVAARVGGGDLSANPRLRRAVQSARDASMPKDNIERAIQRGTGEGEGARLEEVTYEGYGPGGVAILVECLTDSRPRTVAQVRLALHKNGGRLSDKGSVLWMFEKRGTLVFENKESIQMQDLQEKAIEAGAEDIQEEKEVLVISTTLEDFEPVHQALAEFQPMYANVAPIAQNEMQVEGAEAKQLTKLLEVLGGLDDVQNVYSSWDNHER